MPEGKWALMRVWSLRLAAFLALLPVLYVLSIGPAVYSLSMKQRRGTLTVEYEERLVKFYEPLEFVYASAPTPVATAFEWYLDLWDRN